MVGMNPLILTGVVIVVLLIVFAILKRLLVAFILLIVLAAFLYFVFVYSGIGKQKNQQSRYNIEYLRNYFCQNIHNPNDSVICKDIVTPIYYDVKSKYTNDQLNKIQQNPVEFFKVLNNSIKEKKPIIVNNLNRTKRQQLWQLFILRLKNTYQSDNFQLKD